MCYVICHYLKAAPVPVFVLRFASLVYVPSPSRAPTTADRASVAAIPVEFFGEVDRAMGGLLSTSSLLSLVYYIRETTRRLQEMHSRAAV